ncbi:hypothetical protein FD46_GL000770 [Liquorilactobacillus oeni DSM 19972]|uniref:Sugar-binding domain-containing protein n=2 Tax=Liquorilactobacillus oeni TaxID=303241 RepID=A0A0R1MBY4_9LACO|nr:hypothetical protein FD46_GL000770 [Liquorilactobacillus oeni DSM 19972]
MGVVTMDSLSYQEKLARIAQDYYLSKMTISQLTKKYQISRYLISRYLDDALSSGIVNIEIKSPTARNFQLESVFKKKFAIAHIYILKNENNPSSDGSNIIKYAAEQIQTIINQSNIVGLSWGGTVFNIIDHFHSDVKPKLTFTQFMGENMKYNSLAGSTRMTERAANKLGAQYVTMPAPLYITNNTIRKELPEEPALRKTFKMAHKMDMLFCGLGTFSSINSIPAWKQSKSLIFPDVDPSKIAGMLFGRPYDINGNFLIPTKDTTLSIDLQSIMATPRKFGILKSRFKTNAALGALRGNILTDLIMDESIAQRILSADKEM